MFNKSNIKIVKNITIETLVSQNQDIDASDLDGEKVMMNLDKGEYFMMNEIGSRIWDIIENPVKVDEVVVTLLSEYEVDRETCENTVLEFLGRLNNAELITVN